jgi:ABC-type uncharacterized transport system auxiliary subunit
MHHSSRLPVVLLVLLTAVLNACSSLTTSDQPAVTTWWLTPYTGGVSAGDPQALSPVSLTFDVVPGLDTDQILTLSNDSELVPYSGAKWADNLPELVGSLVSRTVAASGRFEVVSGRVSAASERCDLQLELREFFARVDSEGQTTRVQIAIDGHYQCGSGQPAILRLKASQPVPDNRMKLIVAAFQQSLDSVMKDLLAQLP